MRKIKLFSLVHSFKAFACVCNESFGQAALRNFRFVILVIALNTFNIFSTPDQCRASE